MSFHDAFKRNFRQHDTQIARYGMSHDYGSSEEDLIELYRQHTDEIWAILYSHRGDGSALELLNRSGGRKMRASKRINTSSDFMLHAVKTAIQCLAIDRLKDRGLSFEESDD